MRRGRAQRQSSWAAAAALGFALAFASPAGLAQVVTFPASVRAEAQAEPQAQEDARQVVLTAATADDAQRQRLEAAVQQAAVAAHLRVVALRVARVDLADVLADGPSGPATPVAPAPVARLWIDAAGGSPAALYLTDGARRRVYVRQVPLARGVLDRVALESIALIVESSLSALVAGQQIGVSREVFAGTLAAVAPPPVLRPPPAAPPSPPRPTTVSAGYEVIRAAPLPYQHRVFVSFQYQLPWSRIGAGADVFAAAPQAIGNVPAGARLLTAGLNLSVRARWAAGESVRLTTGAGVGVEGVRVEPRVATATVDLRATSPFWSGALSMRGFGLIERALTPLGDRWLVGLLVGVEAHPSPERYLISDEQGTQVVFQAPRWRLLAGVLIGARI